LGKASVVLRKRSRWRRSQEALILVALKPSWAVRRRQLKQRSHSLVPQKRPPMRGLGRRGRLHGWLRLLHGSRDSRNKARCWVQQLKLLALQRPLTLPQRSNAC
jgi:hypothetical protein